jgi:hypothetical protein
MAKDILTIQEIKEWSLSTNREENAAWHIAAGEGELDALQKIWNWALDILKTEEMKHKLLLYTDNYGDTALVWAALNWKTVVLQEIWKCAIDILTA